MHHRRDFMRIFGAGAAALSSPWLLGCETGPSAGSAPVVPAYPPMDTPLTLGGDPTAPFWMRGNYGPVPDEMEAFDLEIIGSLPPELTGTFLRNGSNPIETPAHWFLGDGMLHGVRLEEGRARWYRNRWIRTEAFDGKQGIPYMLNRANTSLINLGGRVMALYEGGAPYEVQTDLSTVGEYTFGDALQGPMTAHPKVDPRTGELHFFGYSPIAPFLRYTVVGADGQMAQVREIDVPRATMMHDFQLSQRYAVFMDLPIVFDLEQLQFPLVWRPEFGARFGLIPRNGDAPIWVDVDPCYVFHTFNAYEDAEGRVVVEGCRLESLWAEGPSDTRPSQPWQWVIDPVNKTVSEGPMLDLLMDFPIIDDRVQGIEHKVAYGLQLAEAVGDYPVYSVGIVKIDRVTGATDVWHTGDAAQPDEALFIPGGPGEDDGWLVSMVYNRATDKSEVVVLDASKPSAGPLARVLMPRRVPFGFHGLWMPG